MSAPTRGDGPPSGHETAPGWAALIAVVFAGAALWATRGPIPLEPLVLQLTTGLVLMVLSLAAVGLGASTIRLLPGVREETGATWWTLVMVAGVTCMMAWAGLLAVFRALRPVPLGAFLGASAAFGGWVVMRRRPFRNLTPFGSSVAPAVLLGFGALVSFPILPAFLPMYDTLNYHLGIPFQWLRASTLTVFPRDVYSLLPSNVGLLYTYTLGLLGPWAAQAAHWWLGGVALLGVVAIGRRLGPSESGGVWGAALFATMPAFLAVSTVAYSGLGATAFGAAAWILAIRGMQNEQRGVHLPFVAGVAAGLALGCKYTSGFTLLVPLLGATLLVGSSLWSWRRRLLATGSVVAGAAMAFLPWALRNLVLTGNPLYPYLGRIWAALGIPVPAPYSTAGSLSQGLGAVLSSPPSLRRALSLGALGTPSHGGLIGPVFLVLLPVTLWFVVRSWRASPSTRALAVGSLLAYSGWFLEPPLGRYLLPGLVPLAALTGAGVATMVRRSSRGIAVTVVGGLLFLGLWNVAGSLDRVWPVRLTVALGQESPGVLLQRFVSYWPAVDVIQEKVPREAKILLVAEARTLFWERDVVPEDPFHSPMLVELAETRPSAHAMGETLREMGLTYVLVNETEARRIARMVGRQEYLKTSSAAARDRLARFFESELIPVWKGPGLTLYALRGGAGQSAS